MGLQSPQQSWDRNPLLFLDMVMNVLNGAGQMLQSVRSSLFLVVQPRAVTPVPPTQQVTPRSHRRSPLFQFMSVHPTQEATSNVFCRFYPFLSSPRSKRLHLARGACSEPPPQLHKRLQRCTLLHSHPFHFPGPQTVLLWLFERAVGWRAAHHANCCINNRVAPLPRLP